MGSTYYLSGYVGRCEIILFY